MKYMYNKRGQVTLFVIIAILIVAVVAAFYFLAPGIKTNVNPQAQTPEAMLRNCIEDSLNEAVEKVSLQGGILNPTLYYLYESNKISYVCYTEEYHTPCVVQRIFLKENIESELKTNLQDETKGCFDNLKQSYQQKGYEVQLDYKDLDVILMPKVIIFKPSTTLTLRKGGQTNLHENFDITLNNNLYELATISETLVQWETLYGDARTTDYMSLYRDIKFEKIKQDDGTTVYILTNRDSEDKFQFAVRSYVFPPGYG